MIRIRYKTWYWGNFILAMALPTGVDADSWEVYDEEKHGWHHSEEARAKS